MKLHHHCKKIFFSVLIIGGMIGGVACDSSTSAIEEEEIIEPTPEPETETNLCADEYPCQNITLLANLTPEELLGERLNDIWGWTDPQTGKEYALVGLTDRLTFVDISTPEEPTVVGTLPESIDESSSSNFNFPFHSGNKHDDGEGKSAWRDIKVYQNHAYVVSDGQPHGLQIFDLKRLRNLSDTPATFTEDVHYTEFGNAHNIAINKESGFAYVAGSNRVGGGLFILDINSPQNPQFAGFHADSTVGLPKLQEDDSRITTGYVHDTQCVMYNGPDADYSGQEVCFNSSETDFVIADVTDKSATETISVNGYTGSEYAHQGWLTEDHRYFLLDDELDENDNGAPTTTYIWDVQDLDNPELVGPHKSELSTIDHNQYVKGNYTYQANYTSGLRVFDLSNVGSGTLEEVAYFDTYPFDDRTKFDGAWSNYPYFESGNIIVSDVSNGLFVLSPDF